MENCLVTKLKGVVENDNLPILGKLAFKATKTATSGNDVYGLNRIEFNEDTTIEVLHGSIGGKNSITIPANNYMYLNSLGVFKTDEGYDYLTIVVPKYKISQITFLNPPDFSLTINMGDFEYSMIKSVYVYSVSSEYYTTLIMNKFKSEKLVSIRIPHANIQGEPFDVTDLGLNGILTTVSFIGIKSNMKGSLNNLGFSPISFLQAPDTKDVSFNIEQFVANNRTAGRTTGSISLPWIGGCNCTFNGATVLNKSDNSLAWTDTTITFNEVTIDA